MSGGDSRVNEATAVFTEDGKTMYFTRNNTTSSGKRKLNKDRVALLKIYRATLSDDNHWVNIEDLPFNSDNFSSANPALTPDGKWLYFSSDREGTLGQSDIFRVAVFDNGGFGEVENLGNKVNTEGRETFPFISKEWVLFFSSDGHPGLGGLDVFATKLNKDGSVGEVINMGAPINSSADDFAISIDTETNTGFVSSNRAQGKGGDDIYSFVEKKCFQTIEGLVLDMDTKDFLSSAKITVFDSNFETIQEHTTDSKGFFKLENLSCNEKYRLRIEQTDYNTDEIIISLTDVNGYVTRKDITLEKTEKPLEKNDDLFKILNLRPIYFDFDKAEITSVAAMEIMKVVEVLKLYPSMKIDVRSHTDSRGNDAYNLKLSDRRAKATVNWIMAQGIDPSQVKGEGYGETQLLNHCENGVDCSDIEHQFNRRSEFIILEL
ncbi:MAG: OmpA family protein, partial [Flavobacterium sp.]